MTSTVAISYINLAASVSSLSGTWEAAAPLSNILTPRLGQKAIRASGDASFSVYFGSGSPTLLADIGLVAILNHNIIRIDGVLNVEIIIVMEDGTTYSSLGWDGLQLQINPSDGYFQSHLIWNAIASYPAIANQRCESVQFNITMADVICGTRNAYTGEIVSGPLSIGGVWIGPVFRPRMGIALDGFAQSITDRSQVVTSIGGQVWSEPEVRQRSGKITFPALYESEVYAIAPTQSLQQLSAHCGTSRPLLVIPTTSTDELMYAQAIYGYMPQPASWQAFEKADDAGVLKRLYNGTIEIVEAR